MTDGETGQHGWILLRGLMLSCKRLLPGTVML